MFITDFYFHKPKVICLAFIGDALRHLSLALEFVEYGLGCWFILVI